MRALLLAALVAAPSSIAQKHQVDFTSMDSVAMAVLAVAYERHPHYYEYGGVIVKMPSGKFNASAPQTAGHASNLPIDEDPESYDGNYPVVADYHTHPCIEGYAPGVFSPADLSDMRSANHPGYILDECTGLVHYWAPGDPYDNDERAQLATGRIVGHINVDGKSISL